MVAKICAPSRMGHCLSLWGGVKVAATSRKVASEKNRVPISPLESELTLYWLRCPFRLVLIASSRYTQP